METAVTQPNPYLINGAGGISRVKEFTLIHGQLTLVPDADQPLSGLYQLIYRCPSHPNADVRRAVSSDGTNWTVAEPLSDEDDCDVCYPGPCN